MQQSGVEIEDELTEFSGLPERLHVREKEHVLKERIDACNSLVACLERVDREHWQILCCLAQMLQRVGEFVAVGKERVHSAPLIVQLAKNEVGEELVVLLVGGISEVDEERISLFSQLLHVLEGHLSHDRNALVVEPLLDKLVVREVTRELQSRGRNERK